MELSFLVRSLRGTLLCTGAALAAGGTGQAIQGGAAYASQGLHLMAQVHPDSIAPPQLFGTKCWGYTSPAGREYAVFGTHEGTALVEVTDPGTPQVVGVVPGPPTHYRTVRTYAHYAYAVCNGGGGIQVIDLGQVDRGVVTLVGAVGGLSGASHNLDIDETSGFLYRVGFETGNPGLMIYDLADPASPQPVGLWSPMTHDVEVLTYTSGPRVGRQVAFACTQQPEALSLVDVTSKAAPVLLGQLTYPNPGLSHQVSLSEDLRYAFLNDEYDEPLGGQPSTVHVFDVQDPDAASYLGSFTNGNLAMTHDGYVKGTRLYCANYASGLRVFDVSAPPSGFEVAWFDTWRCNDAPIGVGLYSVYPYFASGVLIGNDIQGGLFVWTEGPPRLTFGYPRGKPTRFEPLGASLVVTLAELNPGEYLAGSARLELDWGAGPVSVPLVSEGAELRADLPPLPCGAVVRYTLSARTTDGFTWRDPQPAASGAAAHRATVASAETSVYLDDFEQPGDWTAYAVVPGTGAWERAVPTPSPWGPSQDHTPQGLQCWVTEDEAGDCSSDGEVTGGPYFLTSPRLDLSSLSDPYVRYARWFSNTGGEERDDRLLVEVSADGQQWVPVEAVGPALPPGQDTLGGWVVQQFRVRDHVPLTVKNRVRFQVADDQEHAGGGGVSYGGNSLVEAAIDDFEVLELLCLPAASYCTAGTSAGGCQATLSAVGNPSASAASGFAATAQGAEGGRSGLFYFGTSGRQAQSWGTGSSFQCVVPPLTRLGLLQASGTPGSCDGSFQQDLNASWCPACPQAAKNPGAGALVQLQLWYRDPLSTASKTTSLSDALEFTVQP